MKERLYQETDRIVSVDIRKFVKISLDHASELFWVCPSSSSGKYHPPEDQGKYGLIRHILKASEVSYELANFYNLDTIGRDIVVGAAILHDIQKNGIPWGEKTNYQHGKIAFEWLEQFSSLTFMSDTIRCCIRYHMGRWCEPKEELQYAMNPTKYELIVQMADYICSRKNVSFLPGIDLANKAIEDYIQNSKVNATVPNSL